MPIFSSGGAGGGLTAAQAQTLITADDSKEQKPDFDPNAGYPAGEKGDVRRITTDITHNGEPLLAGSILHCDVDATAAGTPANWSVDFAKTAQVEAGNDTEDLPGGHGIPSGAPVWLTDTAPGWAVPTAVETLPGGGLVVDTKPTGVVFGDKAYVARGKFTVTHGLLLNTNYYLDKTAPGTPTTDATSGVLLFTTLDANTIHLQLNADHTGNDLLTEDLVSEDGLTNTLETFENPEPVLLKNIPVAAYAAWSMLSITEVPTLSYAFMLRNMDNQDVRSFAGGEAEPGGEAIAWLNGSPGALVIRYDQTGNGRHLIQPNVDRQYKIIEGGARIDPVPTNPGLGAHYYVLDFGLSGAAGMTVVTAYSSVGAAAANTPNGVTWTYGSSGDSGMLGQYPSSGIFTTPGETIAFEGRPVPTGPDRLARAGSTTYARAANEVAIESVHFGATGISHYVGVTPVATTIDLVNEITVGGDWSPSSRLNLADHDIFYVGAIRAGTGPVSHTVADVDTMVVFEGDQSAHVASLHAELDSVTDREVTLGAFNVKEFDPANTLDPQYQAFKLHIERTLPDILIVPEVELAGRTVLASSFAPEFGYKSVFFGEDEELQVAIFSKFPVLKAESVRAPDGANEGLRRPRYIEVNIHGTLVGIYGVHYATWCNAGVCNIASPFRDYERSIQMERIRLHKAEREKDNPFRKYIIAGDMNTDSKVLPVPPDVLVRADPAGFVSGSDIQFPIAGGFSPDTPMARAGFTLIRSLTSDGEESSVNVDNPTPALDTPILIDYIGTDGITVTETEIVHSEVADQDAGVQKYGPIMPPGTSEAASDHRLIIAKLQF